MRSDQRSAKAAEYRAWYNTARWRAIRANQLSQFPLCRMCEAAGRVRAATICDHVQPHRGDPELFWGGPFQSLCKPHHDSAKQAEEKRGFSGAVDDHGWPTDPKHPANRATVR